ncbi:MAG: threonine-phosphate decarboxylase [Methylophaga sp.]|nr:threonine-phosphate decarboxylase [Methylophaga sp.]
MLEHGGKLNSVARHYGIALNDWLDLSTGINPNGWPIPETLPRSIWSDLPQDDDGLIKTARDYYQCNSLLAVSGSQAAIQALPKLRAHSKVGVMSPAYAEHAYAWKLAGHDVITLETATISAELSKLDVLIIINPNNPTGQKISPQQLIEWHQQLAQNDGWLIVDEAFIDVTPKNSLSQCCPKKGLIVLRSIGKFFGLAGLRTGFVLAEDTLLVQLAEYLGPWPIASASRYITQLALADKNWQQDSRYSLAKQGQRLENLLGKHGFNKLGGCALFQWAQTKKSEQIYHQLAQQGIYTRLFAQPKSLRFGLPKTEDGWQRLSAALQELNLT